MIRCLGTHNLFQMPGGPEAVTSKTLLTENEIIQSQKCYLSISTYLKSQQQKCACLVCKESLLCSLNTGWLWACALSLPLTAPPGPPSLSTLPCVNTRSPLPSPVRLYRCCHPIHTIHKDPPPQQPLLQLHPHMAQASGGVDRFSISLAKQEWQTNSIHY